VKIYLASRSPRRRELLALLGVEFTPIDLDLDETQLSGEPPATYVERLARAKAEAGWQEIATRSLARAPVLGSDTTVALEGRIFGKPADRREAAEMLAALSGRTHEVLTAVALKFEARLESVLSVSSVTFRTLSTEEIAGYDEWQGKAGAYAVQGAAASFLAELRGSFSGVMGLPLCETARLLERIGR
jgi:septum formation protein